MSKTTVSASATGLPESDELAAAIAKLAAARAEKQPLIALNEARHKARVSLDEVCDFLDYISEDDPSYALLDTETERRRDAEDAAITAICSYSVRTLEEARSKAIFIKDATRGCLMEEHQVKALLQSFINSVED